MYPKWHILWGAVFTILIWIFSPEISLFYLTLIFLASFLIDFDHYLCAVSKTKKVSLKEAFDFHELAGKEAFKKRDKGKREIGHFFFLHTVEFHVLIAFLGLFWEGFYFVLLGMIFHSLLDLAYLLYHDIFFVREYFFFNWLRKKSKKTHNSLSKKEKSQSP